MRHHLAKALSHLYTRSIDSNTLRDQNAVRQKTGTIFQLTRTLFSITKLGRQASTRSARKAARLRDYPARGLRRHYLNQLLFFLEGFMEVRKGISALCFQNLQPFLQLLDFLFTLVPGLFGNSSETVSAWLSRLSYTLERLT